jgi:hypothetical protein
MDITDSISIIEEKHASSYQQTIHTAEAKSASDINESKASEVVQVKMITCYQFTRLPAPCACTA